MDHIAIMKNNGFLEKIESGEKAIESRWYKFKKIPYGIVKPNEQIYFKRSGKDVTLTSKISRVIQFDEINEKKIKEILNIYGKDIGIEEENTNNFFCQLKIRNIVSLCFLLLLNISSHLR